MSFLQDKGVGEEFEQTVIQQFQTEWGIKLEKNSNIKGVDLLHKLMAVEVKFDRRVGETGNTFIEIYNLRSMKRSGVMAVQDVRGYLFVIGCEKETLVFHTKALQELVLDWAEDGKFRLINGGDGWKSRGLLVEWQTLREFALHIFPNE